MGGWHGSPFTSIGKVLIPSPSYPHYPSLLLPPVPGDLSVPVPSILPFCLMLKALCPHILLLPPYQGPLFSLCLPFPPLYTGVNNYTRFKTVDDQAPCQPHYSKEANFFSLFLLLSFLFASLLHGLQSKFATKHI